MPDGGTPEGAGIEAGGLEDPRAPWEQDVEDPAAPRALLAVMFTDIVGSTALATALGDKRWRELLEQHDVAIREQIARFEGREVDTAGDAFFATFGRPIQAVDCALESARAVRRLGLRIRAGIHMGECVVTTDKVRGVTVHIGARVGAKARGDEVLVSSTVRDILVGQGLTLSDRGEQTLKGIEGKWRLYAVEPRIRDNEADLPPLLEIEIPKPPKPVWWRRPRIVAAVMAFAVLVGAVAYVTLRGGGLSTVDADSLAVISASGGSIDSAFPVGRRPTGVAATRDGVWVTNSVDRTVSFLSPDGKTERRSGALGTGPGAIAIGPSAVWVANLDGQSVSRLDLRTASQIAGSDVLTGNGLSAITYAAGSMWVTNAVDGTVWRFDEKTGNKTLDVAVGPALRGIAADRSAVWVTSETAGTVTRLDPASGAIGRVVQVGNGPGSVAIGAGAVWVANALDGTVSRVDPRSGTVAATIRVGEGPRSVVIAKQRVFVANETGATVSVIDPGSNKVVDTISVGNAPMGLATDGEQVWMSVRGGIKNYQGGTLRFSTAFPAETMDPAMAFGQFAVTVFPATHDGLLSFKRVGGVEGSQLLPNLAEEFRAPTDGGKTWSFTLREGLRYSDGTPVKASDVRHSIERVFTVDENSFGASFMTVIEGGEACSLKGCDLSKGIETNDEARSIVFHLRAPLVDFAYFLALPISSIVPGTTPKTNAGFTAVPGTGPYRFASMAETRVTLERNPHFRSRGPAQPDGYADRIEITWGTQEPKVHVDDVIAGRKDFTIDLLEPDIPTLEIVNQVPAQVHVFDLQSLLYALMNPNLPPFTDVRVRQAVNYAVDRKALAEVVGAPLLADHTCQILTKNLVGYVPYCPYTVNPNPSGIWNGPDIAKARELVRASGMAGRRVSIWVEPERQRRIDLANIFVDTLNRIGLRARVELFDGFIVNALLDGTADLQMAIEGWAVDYPGAGSFFLPLLTCPAFFGKITGNPDASFNLARFCSPEIDRLVEQALTKQSDDILGSIRAWADVDKRVSDLAPWVPIATFRIAHLVSARVGNVLTNPTLGPLITQMWLTDRK
jgi:peptide/nickel transport system substrate-binding protein